MATAFEELRALSGAQRLEARFDGDGGHVIGARRGAGAVVLIADLSSEPVERVVRLAGRDYPASVLAFHSRRLQITDIQSEHQP